MMMRRGSALDAEAMARGLGREATLGCSSLVDRGVVRRALLPFAERSDARAS